LSFELKSFGKAQISAFLGGMVDYAIMVFCAELLGLHYIIGIIVGGIIGAGVNFSLNKYWTFSYEQKSNLRSQLLKFGCVVIGSIALKSVGTYTLTEILLLDYRISRLIIDLLVSLGFNYTMQRFWVFEK